MINISYAIGCRNCLKSDGIRHSYLIMNEGDEKYKKKTEYEMMSLIEEWRQVDGRTCKICSSSNVEVLDIHINDYPLYDYDNLVKSCMAKHWDMIMLNIDKSDSDIMLSSGGSQNIKFDTFRAAIQEIINTIDSQPASSFISKTQGNFFICLTGGRDFITNKLSVRIERFRSAGLTKVEILNEIQPLARQVGINLPQNIGSSIKKTDFLDDLPF